MKNLFLSALAIATIAFTSCDSDDQATIVQTNTTTDDSNVVVTGEIAGKVTWSADKIYQLRRRVVVVDGGELTIEAGTIIKAEKGTGSLASTLIVARGGKIFANGTKDAPIIMTTVEDNIEIGQVAGTNLDENDRGFWGGLLILGKAPCSFKQNVTELQIEGIPVSDTNGLYGGNIADDNSGVIKYVSIRHGGAEIGEGNEINGLTLGGVGSGTVINHVEVVGNVDDGVEFFGGTVNASNLIVWGQGDDALDIDQAYSGTIKNAVVVLGAASDHALEIDGPEGNATGSFTIDGATLYGNTETEKGEIADYRSDATGLTKNIRVLDFKDNSDVELDNNGVAQNFIDKKLSFENWNVANTVFVEKVKKDENDVAVESTIITPDFTEQAKDWTNDTATGADTSVFGWSLTGINNNALLAK